MNDNVVQLHPNKKASTLTGEAYCVCCQHKWVAVAPEGVTFLECPSCHTEKGRFFYPVLIRDAAYWVCMCGNDLFFINPDGCYCPNCGVACVFP